jgi:hypothetical protein
MSEISRKEFEEYREGFNRAVKRLSNVKEEMKISMGYIKQTMEVGLASFGMAWALARWGGPSKTISVIGIPVELGAALVLKGVGFTGLLDEYSADAHNLGDGLLSVYLVKKGFELGQPSTAASGSMAVGALPAGNPLAQSMADAELARAMAA